MISASHFLYLNQRTSGECFAFAHNSPFNLKVLDYDSRLFILIFYSEFLEFKKLMQAYVMCQECFAQGLVMEAIEVAKTKVSDSFPSHHFSDTLTTTEQSGLVPGIWLVHCCVVALICFGFLVYRNYNVKRKNQRELILLRAEKEKQKVQCDLLEKEVEWKSEQLSRLSIGLERQMNFGEKMLDLTRSLTTIFTK